MFKENQEVTIVSEAYDEYHARTYGNVGVIETVMDRDDMPYVVAFPNGKALLFDEHELTAR